MGDDGNILASDDTAGKVPNAQGQFAFSLTGIPVGQNVRIYLLHNGAIFPMFIGANNVFSLTTIGTVDLGIVVTDPTTGQALAACGDGSMTLVSEGPEGKFNATRIETRPGARTIALDPKSDTIYLLQWTDYLTVE